MKRKTNKGGTIKCLHSHRVPLAPLSAKCIYAYVMFVLNTLPFVPYLNSNLTVRESVCVCDISQLRESAIFGFLNLNASISAHPALTVFHTKSES